MIILLGLVVCALFGAVLAFAGATDHKVVLFAIGLALFVLPFLAAFALMLSCDPGCEV